MKQNESSIGVIPIGRGIIVTHSPIRHVSESESKEFAQVIVSFITLNLILTLIFLSRYFMFYLKNRIDFEEYLFGRRFSYIKICSLFISSAFLVCIISYAFSKLIF